MKVSALLCLLFLSLVTLCSARPQNVECTVCENLVTLVENELEPIANATYSDVENLIKEACSIFGSLESICEKIINKYLNQLIYGILDDTSPLVLCQDIGLCSSSSPKMSLPSCDGCDALLAKVTDEDISSPIVGFKNLKGYCASAADSSDCLRLGKLFLILSDRQPALRETFCHSRIYCL